MSKPSTSDILIQIVRNNFKLSEMVYRDYLRSHSAANVKSSNNHLGSIIGLFRINLCCFRCLLSLGISIKSALIRHIIIEVVNLGMDSLNSSMTDIEL